MLSRHAVLSRPILSGPHAVLCCAVCREAGTIEVELEQLKGSVMALTVAANSSAEGETYRELADALLRVRGWLLSPTTFPCMFRRWWYASSCSAVVHVLPSANNLNTNAGDAVFVHLGQAQLSEMLVV
jgi:hypothetical protein